MGVLYDVENRPIPTSKSTTLRSIPKEAKTSPPTRPSPPSAADEGQCTPRRRREAEAPRPYDAEPMPALAARVTTAGVDWKYYEGAFPWVPDFRSAESSASGTGSLPDIAVRKTREYFGLLFWATSKCRRRPLHIFAADTGALLRLHEATIIDADFGYASWHGTQRNRCAKAGLLPFRISYSMVR